MLRQGARGAAAQASRRGRRPASPRPRPGRRKAKAAAAELPAEAVPAFEALRAWRAEQAAKEQGVPAYVDLPRRDAAGDRDGPAEPVAHSAPSAGSARRSWPRTGRACWGRWPPCRSRGRSGYSGSRRPGRVPVGKQAGQDLPAQQVGELARPVRTQPAPAGGDGGRALPGVVPDALGGRHAGNPAETVGYGCCRSVAPCGTASDRLLTRDVGGRRVRCATGAAPTRPRRFSRVRPATALLTRPRRFSRVRPAPHTSAPLLARARRPAGSRRPAHAPGTTRPDTSPSPTRTPSGPGAQAVRVTSSPSSRNARLPSGSSQRVAAVPGQFQQGAALVRPGPADRARAVQVARAQGGPVDRHVGELLGGRPVHGGEGRLGDHVAVDRDGDPQVVAAGLLLGRSRPGRAAGRACGPGAPPAPRPARPAG